MTKTILGLDLGTTSIGWALVKEGKDADIIKTGVRIIPLSSDEIQNFDKGKSITTNADRTLKRSARRNLQRYKLRRNHLIKILIDKGLISEETILNEVGNYSTFQTYKLRNLAVSEQIELDEFARILLMLNKKRGYKSSRKAKGEDEGMAVDGMEIAKLLYEENLTPGQLVYQRFSQGKTSAPDFYRSDLQAEFDSIWNYQKQFYPEFLTDDLYEGLKGKTKTISAGILRKQGLDGVELKGKLSEKKRMRYELRAKAVNQQCSLDEISEILPEINQNINQSSGYLGAISDRSKELFFNNQTIGQFLYEQIEKNPHLPLKNQVFYRQDYLDEFNRIWEKQAEYYPETLTAELKADIRDTIIFYQRRLKSQKSLLSICEFEGKQVEIEIDGVKKKRVIGPKVCPKSSPIFQEFKIWSQLNNITYSNSGSKKSEGISLELEQMKLLYDELNWRERLSSSEAIKLLGISGYELNFKEIEGNRTNAAFIKVLNDFFANEGHDELNLFKMNSKELKETLELLFPIYGINLNLLQFNSNINGQEIEKQEFYEFWHLLYSYEGDNSPSGINSLREKLADLKFGFPKESNSIITNISLPDDYSSLSARAIRKILPFLKEGNRYDLACLLAGYNHSHSETKADLDNKILKDELDLLAKNTLRNPVVEKILNQMINVVNTIIETYGKPDEIRVEMARELKKSAKERELATKAIRQATDEHTKLKKELQSEFGLNNVSRNDLIRYKLYLELKDNGYKTLYSNQAIDRAKLFSSEYDIEHIIPQSKLFDDSFSNKTLELRSVNLKKGNDTAYDFILKEYGEEGLKQYEARINSLFSNQFGKKSKHKKLLMAGEDIPKDFIERELRDTQYIAKKAKDILSSIVRNVGTTTGSITERLRQDWQLVDVLKELNWNKYDKLGMTETFENRHGEKIKRITDWTKRNDHRHHAMDAITVAFTKREYVKYFNNLNAKSDKDGEIYKILKTETYFDQNQKRRINPPMPIEDFRKRAKEHLENTLISFKTKNKVVTNNKNITKTTNGKSVVIQQTPRGQLHLETVYGSSLSYKTKIEKVNASFDTEKIKKVANQKHRSLLLERLLENGNDPKKAFTGANSLSKNPIYLNKVQTYKLPEAVKLVEFETQYTIRKPITPDLKIDKVIDKGVQRILLDRLKTHNNDAKKAFSNLEEDPIYLNKEKGIVLKRVTIQGINNAVALHSKKDHLGNELLDVNGNAIPVDFVNTGNNHHVAIYRDENDNLKEEVVSFFEAVTRQNQGLPIIKKQHELGWEFLFTMKQNEYFVFPNEETGFDPSEIDLLDPTNYAKISPNLFRVQKLTSGDFWFRHHLETQIDVNPLLKDITFKRIGLSSLKNIEKIRVDHLGIIISVRVSTKVCHQRY
jgi:CRISPR-associated endonuclease Csn1